MTRSGGKNNKTSKQSIIQEVTLGNTSAKTGFGVVLGISLKRPVVDPEFIPRRLITKKGRKMEEIFSPYVVTNVVEKSLTNTIKGKSNYIFQVPTFNGVEDCSRTR